MTRTGARTERLAGRHGHVEVRRLDPGRHCPTSTRTARPPCSSSPARCPTSARVPRCSSVRARRPTCSRVRTGCACCSCGPRAPAGGDRGAATGRQRPHPRPSSPPVADSPTCECAGWSVARPGLHRPGPGDVDVRPDGHHELHRHPHAEEFFMVLDGGGEHLTETGAIRMGPGDVVLVAAGEWHGYRTDPGVTTTTVYGYLGAASLDEAGYEVRS
ncbi:cupin domain-containing protein [Micromonospora sp. M12]